MAKYLYKEVEGFLSIVYNIIERVKDFAYKDKKRRYVRAAELYDATNIIHSEYMMFLSRFESEVHQMVWRKLTVEDNEKSGKSFLDIKKKFDEELKGRFWSRSEPKGKADSFLSGALDEHEARFLFSIIWYYQYNDGTENNNISESEIDRLLGEAEKGNFEKSVDTPTTVLMYRISNISDPELLLPEIRKSKESLTKRFGMVEWYFLGLQKTWWQVSDAERKSFQ